MSSKILEHSWLSKYFPCCRWCKMAWRWWIPSWWSTLWSRTSLVVRMKPKNFKHGFRRSCISMRTLGWRQWSTPYPSDVAQGWATKLCWGPFGRGFGVSVLCNNVEVAQAHVIPCKEKATRWPENKPFLNILCIFLYGLTTFSGFKSLVVKSVRI